MYINKIEMGYEWRLPAAKQPLNSLLILFLFPWKAFARIVGQSEAGDLGEGATQWPVLQVEAAFLTDSTKAWAQTATTTGKCCLPE